jgi:hypothetical protein
MCRKKIIQGSGIVLILSGIAGLFLSPVNFSGFLKQLQIAFNQEISENYSLFHIETFEKYILYYIALISVLTGFIFLIFNKKITEYCGYFIKLLQKTLKYLSELPVLYKKSLLILITANILIKTYYLIKMPVFVDEAWTYFVFSKKGFLTAISYYPAPNNHILHSILTSVSVHLPLPLLLSLRLPNFIINIVAIILFFIVFGKLFSHKIALFFSMVFSTMFPLMYYAYIARGYMLYLIGFLLLFYLAVQSLKNNKLTKSYPVIWIIATLTGFYSLPAFLYPYLSIYIFLSIRFYRKKDLSSFKKIQITNLIATVLVLVIYFPVILVSGLNALIDNPYVKPHNRIAVFRNFDEHFDETSLFLFNLPLIISFIIAIVYFYYFKKKNWIPEVKLAFFILVFSPFVMLVHATLPMPRIWIYWLIPVLFLTAHLYQAFANHKYKWRQELILFMSIAFLQLLIFHFRLPRYESDSFIAKNVSEYLLQQNVKEIYNGHYNYLGTSIRFHYKQKNKPLKIFEAYRPLSTDKLNQYKYFLMRNPIDDSIIRKFHLQEKVFTFYSSKQYLYFKTQ